MISAEHQAKFTLTHRGHNIHEQWSIFPSSIHRLQLVEYVIVAILYSHPFLEDGTKTLIAINHSRPTFLSKACKHKHQQSASCFSVASLSECFSSWCIVETNLISRDLRVVTLNDNCLNINQKLCEHFCMKFRLSSLTRQGLGLVWFLKGLLHNSIQGLFYTSVSKFISCTASDICP